MKLSLHNDILSENLKNIFLFQKKELHHIMNASTIVYFMHLMYAMKCIFQDVMNVIKFLVCLPI